MKLNQKGRNKDHIIAGSRRSRQGCSLSILNSLNIAGRKVIFLDSCSQHKLIDDGWGGGGGGGEGGGAKVT